MELRGAWTFDPDIAIATVLLTSAEEWGSSRVSGCSELTWGEGQVHISLRFEQPLACRWCCRAPTQALVLGWLWSPWHFPAFAEVFCSFLRCLGVLGFMLQGVKAVTCMRGVSAALFHQTDFWFCTFCVRGRCWKKDSFLRPQCYWLLDFN